MMYNFKSILKKVLRWCGILALWTFAFSININGKPVFQYANEIMVKNALVQNTGSKIIEIWDKATGYTKLALQEFYQDKNRKKMKEKRSFLNKSSYSEEEFNSSNSRTEEYN